MTIQTMAESLAARDSGMQSSAEHCESVQPNWSDMAHTCLAFYAYHKAVMPFTVEEVREWAEARGLITASKRGWGGITRAAKERGLIEQVGYAPTKASNGSVRATYQVKGKS